MKKVYILFGLVILSATSILHSQTDHNNFDFLLGNWQAKFEDSITATYSAQKQLNNFMIEEYFEFDNHGFAFKSTFYFDPYINKWRYNSVDNAGGHFYLTGAKEGSEMVFRQKYPYINKDGKKYYCKLVYRNFSATGFEMQLYYSGNNKKFSSLGLIHCHRK